MDLNSTHDKKEDFITISFLIISSLLRINSQRTSVMAAYGQTQYSPALQPAGPYTPYAHTQGYSMPSYSE